MLRFTTIICNKASRFHIQCSYYVRHLSNILKENSGIENRKIIPEDKNDLTEYHEEYRSDISKLIENIHSLFSSNNAYKTLDILVEWNKKHNLPTEVINKDKKFKKFLKFIETQNHEQNPAILMKIIFNLLKLGIPADSSVIESLENDLLWSVSVSKAHDLLQIIKFQQDFNVTMLQKQVLEEACNALERRWTEIDYVPDFCLIYELSSILPQNILINMDNHIDNLAEKMNLRELSKLIISISKSGRRPTPLLNTLAYHIFKQDKLSPKQICSIMFAMRSLNFFNERLLSKFSDDLIAQIEEVKQPSIVGRISLCLGQMCYRNVDLLDVLVKWVINNSNICRPNDLGSLLLTLATVSYTPKEVDEYVNLCNERLTLKSITDKNIWIGIVWALAVLEKVTEDQISSVLDSNFTSILPIDNPSFAGSFIKLLNINGVANSMDLYAGPKLSNVIPNNFIPDKNDPMQSYVIKILHNFLPPPKYLREKVHTNMGFKVTAEFVVDKNSKPLVLTDYSTNFGDIKSDKELQKGAHRIALMLWDFKDFTKGSSCITGQNFLAVRLLNKKGYKVVEVPYFDLIMKDKTIRNVQYFERKIKTAIYS